jgi:hypothetical protein
VEEQIQMHADRLYHQMLAQEEELKRAKEEGRAEPPKAESVLPKAPGTAPTDVSESMKKHWKERLEGVAEEDRKAEEMAMHAEFKAQQEVALKMRELEEERKTRRKEGNATLGDRIAGIFGR